jgi:amidase
VACGFTALEYGSDIGGSIRTPANWCGIYGHKPSYGVVPPRGHIPPAPGARADLDLSVCGPLARSADDLLLALEVLAGPDAAHAKAFRFALPAPRGRALADYRLAVWLDDPAFPVDREVGDVLENAVSALERAGARVDRNARPDTPLAELHANYQRLLNPILVAGYPPSVLDALTELARTARKDGPEDALTTFARTAMASHVEWLRSHERRARHAARFESFFERYDALLCPVTPIAAPPHDHTESPLTRKISVNGAPRSYMELFGWIGMATAASLPATVAPVGRTAGGLPVGIQIIGPYLEDRTPIDVAKHMASEVGGYAPPAMVR